MKISKEILKLILILNFMTNSIKPTYRVDYLKNHPEHVITCATWSYNSWGKYNPSRTFDDFVQSRQEYLNTDKLPFTLLAFDDGKPIGMVSLTDKRDIKKELNPWLSTLYVDEAYRNKGVGKFLEETICKKAKQMGYPKIYCFTSDPKVVPWYLKLGWQEISKEKLYDHEVTVLSKEI